jgi:GGDEF domain-containing protein
VGVAHHIGTPQTVVQQRSQDAAVPVERRARSRVADQVQGPVAVTVSVTDREDIAERLLRLADSAMYLAKAAGRSTAALRPFELATSPGRVDRERRTTSVGGVGTRATG